MIDVTKIDEEIRYLNFEPQKKSGGDYRWLVALVLAPYIVALLLFLVGTVLRGYRSPPSHDQRQVCRRVCLEPQENAVCTDEAIASTVCRELAAQQISNTE
jgi:hypothetical protein